MTIDRIRFWAMSQPDKTAVINHGVYYSYASFLRAIGASRQFLDEFGLPVGKTAVVLVQDLFVGWCLVFALRGIGLNTIVVRSIEQAEDLKVKDVGCVVTFQTERTEATLKGSLVSKTRVISVPAEIFAHVHSGSLPLEPNSAPPFGGHILYTSGTTGIHKKVLVNGRYDEARNDAWVRSFKTGVNTVHHNMNFGLWTGACFKHVPAIWHSGGCVILETEAFSVNSVDIERLFKYPITSATVVPTTMRTIADAVAAAGAEFRSHNTLRIRIIGGLVPLHVVEFTSRLITSDILLSYSATELGSNAMEYPFAGKEDFSWFFPSGGRFLQIVDEADNECEVGQEGKFRILLTDIDAKSYLDDDEATTRFFRNGYFYPGDMAVRRKDGRISVLGRVDDVLNLHGAKIPVAPLEADIQRALGVDAVCLFSRLNDQGQEELAIAIETDREVLKSDLEAVARQFSKFQVVRCSIWKSFPRVKSEMQKVKRTALRRMVFPNLNAR